MLKMIDAIHKVKNTVIGGWKKLRKNHDVKNKQEKKWKTISGSKVTIRVRFIKVNEWEKNGDEIKNGKKFQWIKNVKNSSHIFLKKLNNIVVFIKKGRLVVLNNSILDQKIC